MSSIVSARITVETVILYVNLPPTLHEQWSFFLNGTELSLNSANSGNLINHCNMNKGKFKDNFCDPCLLGTEVAYWFLKQAIAGSNTDNFYKNVSQFLQSL